MKIANAVLAAKEVGKGFCVHEVLANKSIDEGSDNPLCPPVIVKEIKEGKQRNKERQKDRDRGFCECVCVRKRETRVRA